MKNNTVSIIRWTAILGIGFILLRNVAYSIWNKIYVGTLSLENITYDTEKINFTILMPLINTGSVSVPIDQFKGVLKYGANVISRINVSTPFTVKANSQDLRVPVKASVYYGDAAYNLLDIFRSKQFKLPLVLVGHVSAKGLDIPINHRII